MSVVIPASVKVVSEAWFQDCKVLACAHLSLGRDWSGSRDGHFNVLRYKALFIRRLLVFWETGVLRISARWDRLLVKTDRS
jgi:hypothetical protein